MFIIQKFIPAVSWLYAQIAGIGDHEDRKPQRYSVWWGGKSHTHIMTPRGTEPENGGRGNHSNLQGREKQI